MDKTQTIIEENKKLNEQFQSIQKEKDLLVKNAEAELKVMSQQQAQVNTTIIKNQGKLELLNETSENIKAIDKGKKPDATTGPSPVTPKK